MKNITFYVELEHYNGVIDIIQFHKRDERDEYMYRQLANSAIKHIAWYEDDGHTQTVKEWLS